MGGVIKKRERGSAFLNFDLCNKAVANYENECRELTAQLSEQTKEFFFQIVSIFQKEYMLGKVSHEESHQILEERARVLICFKEYLAHLSPSESDAIEKLSSGECERLYSGGFKKFLDSMLKGDCSAGANQYLTLMKEKMTI